VVVPWVGRGGYSWVGQPGPYPCREYTEAGWPSVRRLLPGLEARRVSLPPAGLASLVGIPSGGGQLAPRGARVPGGDQPAC